jgi:hypothetical protein
MILKIYRFLSLNRLARLIFVQEKHCVFCEEKGYTTMERFSGIAHESTIRRGSKLETSNAILFRIVIISVELCASPTTERCFRISINSFPNTMRQLKRYLTMGKRTYFLGVATSSAENSRFRAVQGQWELHRAPINMDITKQTPL